ncbi:MAG TPA: plastocyanin/azurin family copper-binding protein [Candidatus Limnocylindrales bacterium]|nr:plastocyanin/azurin family copper-binding protein [Candidatus Limnocylindrales bacterium]
MAVLRVFLASGLVILASACGGGSGAPTQAPASQPLAAAIACTGSSGLPVAIADFTYTPSTITAAVGGTVTWANGDTAPHSVTFDSGPDCLTISSGGLITATFNAAGSYPYHCSVHPSTPSMKGTVVVQ